MFIATIMYSYNAIKIYNITCMYTCIYTLYIYIYVIYIHTYKHIHYIYIYICMYHSEIQ